jgi:voltage-gated potassium channel
VSDEPWFLQTESGRVRHRLEWLMLALALLVIPVVLIEESNGPSTLKAAASAANWVIWTAFLLELVAVLIVAPRKRAALKAHWLETLIVVITPPFLPGVFSAFRGARLIRLLRLSRLGLVGARVIRAERMLTSRQGFRYIALITGLLVVLAGAVISVVESADFPSIGLGIWWAITTVTTVGYGDVVPHSVAGRVVASCLMLLGIGFISILTATVASSFVAHDTEDSESASLEQVMEALHRIEARLDAIEGR